jgi:REP element-mobilizing transposase RayT
MGFSSVVLSRALFCGRMRVLFQSSRTKRYWGQHLWARGYWVASSGNVTDEVWAEYIKNQTPPEPDDDFNVT